LPAVTSVKAGPSPGALRRAATDALPAPDPPSHPFPLLIIILILILIVTAYMRSPCVPFSPFLQVPLNDSLYFHLFQLYFPMITTRSMTPKPLRQSRLQPQ